MGYVFCLGGPFSRNFFNEKQTSPADEKNNPLVVLFASASCRAKP